MFANEPLKKRLVAFTTDDFPLIAETQNAREEAAARTGSPVLFCDTDSFATTVWHERYIGGRNPRVEETADRVAHHLWLLTDHEGVAFEDDGDLQCGRRGFDAGCATATVGRSRDFRRSPGLRCRRTFPPSTSK